MCVFAYTSVCSFCNVSVQSLLITIKKTEMSASVSETNISMLHNHLFIYLDLRSKMKLKYSIVHFTYYLSITKSHFLHLCLCVFILYLGVYIYTYMEIYMLIYIYI